MPRPDGRRLRNEEGVNVLGQCVVVSCEREAVLVVGKPTEWGAWEYWVCVEHKAMVDDSARIDDQPDGCTIVLTRPDGSRPATTALGTVPVQRVTVDVAPSESSPDGVAARR